MGQNFARLGAPDIRKDSVGGIDFRIQRQLRSYAKTDDPPKRVKPIPITIILHLLSWAFGAVGTNEHKAIVDMIVIAFYYLLRPGEYTGTTTKDDAPFRMGDVQLFVHTRQLNVMTASITDIRHATSASLVFTTQKNQIRGELINHGRSSHALACPVKALSRRIIYLRQNNATSKTPIASYWRNNKIIAVRAQDITDQLRSAAAYLQSDTGISPADISARSLRAGGAMALLCGKVDMDLIKMLGRWHSDSMMRYLFLQAQPLMGDFAKKMFNHGTYSFLPHESVPVN